MRTLIYMVRHGESPKLEGNERTRGLTDKGKKAAKRLSERLRDEEIDVFFSSPYLRAVMTLEELAANADKEIQTRENLKELVFSNEDGIMPDHELYPLVSRMFTDRNLRSPGGESAAECQSRAVAVLEELLMQYGGKKIAIGTHGAVMALMMEHYDARYNLDFLLKTSKPDVYKMSFDQGRLIEVERLWAE